MPLDDVVVGDPHVDSHNEERHAINDIQDAIDTGAVVTPTALAAALVDPVAHDAIAEIIGEYYEVGSYTPTLTAVTNVDVASPRLCRWFRVGNLVTVVGRCNIDATAAAAASTVFDASLPIASNVSLADDLFGVISAPGVSGSIGSETISAAKARLTYNSNNVSAIFLAFNFTYIIK